MVEYEVIVSDEKELEEKKKKISGAGNEKFHVIADFDRTLTKCFMEGQKTATVIAQVRNGNYLTPDYAPKAHAFFDYYRPIEIDPNLSLEEKKRHMHDWWMKHFNLLVESGFNKEVIQEIVAKKELEFRDGALEFIDYLHEKKIPLVIMSAGPGDMIEEYLKQEGRMYDNVHVIANLYDWDEKGLAVKVREPIIHSMNKDETAIQGFPVFDLIKDRKNVLLLGDGLGDVGMIKGFDYDNLIKVGFLNEGIEENMEKFKKNFDVVITEDGPMNYINKFLQEIVK